MKKTVISLLAVLLLTALACPALAWSQMGVTMENVKAYSDVGRTKYIGTIPKCTVIKLVFPDQYSEYDGGSYAVYAGKNRYCFVKAAQILDPIGVTLSEGALWSATLKKGARVYQRPAKGSRSVKSGKAVSVTVCYVKGSWALIYRESKAAFGFVRTSALKNVKRIK